MRADDARTIGGEGVDASDPEYGVVTMSEVRALLKLSSMVFKYQSAPITTMEGSEFRNSL